MINKISDLLTSKLSNVYCDTCEFDGNDCDECNRKAMGWRPSKDFCEHLASDITKLFSEESEQPKKT